MPARFILAAPIASLLVLLIALTAPGLAYADEDVSGSYDTNGNGIIDRDEAIAAVADYFAGTITRDQAVEVMANYFSGEPVGDEVQTGDDPSPESTEEPDSQPDPEPLNTMIERVRPSVVKIVSSHTVGSGVLFQTEGETGYVLTSEHVISYKDEVYVLVNDRTYYTGEVVSFDLARDLAVVKICCGDFSTLEFADSETFNVGDETLAIGYARDSAVPRDTDSGRSFVAGAASVTKGIISAFRYSTLLDIEFLQFDGAINRGNSGGPILSMSGDILGIVSYELDYAENMGFAVLETTVQKRLPTLLQGESTYFGPLSGELEHDPDDSKSLLRRTGIYLADFEIEATFFNPYAITSHQWDYGFIIRAGEEHLRVFVGGKVNRRWYVDLYRDGERHLIGKGDVTNLNVQAGESNHLRLIADGGEGTLFLNGEEVGSLDLLYLTSPGYIYIGSGFIKGSEKAGAVTRYEGFTGKPLQ